MIFIVIKGVVLSFLAINDVLCSIALINSSAGVDISFLFALWRAVTKIVHALCIKLALGRFENSQDLPRFVAILLEVGIGFVGLACWALRGLVDQPIQIAMLKTVPRQEQIDQELSRMLARVVDGRVTFFPTLGIKGLAKGIVNVAGEGKLAFDRFFSSRRWVIAITSALGAVLALAIVIGSDTLGAYRVRLVMETAHVLGITALTDGKSTLRTRVHRLPDRPLLADATLAHYKVCVFVLTHRTFIV
jgi:hypothetical protein